MKEPTRESQVEDARAFLDHAREEGLLYTAESRRLLDPELGALRVEYVTAGKTLLSALECALEGRSK